MLAAAVLSKGVLWVLRAHLAPLLAVLLLCWRADGLKSTSDYQIKKTFTDVYSYSQLQVSSEQ